ncbi:hypothetical protein ACLB2K_038575 [Fragaria x ananassa]
MASVPLPSPQLPPPPSTLPEWNHPNSAISLNTWSAFFSPHHSHPIQPLFLNRVLHKTTFLQPNFINSYTAITVLGFTNFANTRLDPFFSSVKHSLLPIIDFLVAKGYYCFPYDAIGKMKTKMEVITETLVIGGCLVFGGVVIKRLLHRKPSWETLPDDIIGMIVPHLSVRDRIRLSIVCKPWSSVSTRP